MVAHHQTLGFHQLILQVLGAAADGRLAERMHRVCPDRAHGWPNWHDLFQVYLPSQVIKFNVLLRSISTSLSCGAHH